MITSPANPSVRAARKLARRRDRTRRGAFLVEGPAVLAEAGAHVTEVFLADDAAPEARQVAEEAAAGGAELHEVAASVLATLADTVTPQGVVGVVEPPETSLADALAGATLVVLCVDLADPGNAGAIVRIADAAAADAVLLSAGSVDPRNPKAVRASAGSLFHLPVVADVDAGSAVAEARRRGLTVLGADAAAIAAHSDERLDAPVMLVLGGEARGLPPDVAAACDRLVRVPMPAPRRRGWQGRAESLNVAATAAVLCFEAARQRGRP